MQALKKIYANLWIEGEAVGVEAALHCEDANGLDGRYMPNWLSFHLKQNSICLSPMFLYIYNISRACYYTWRLM